ncbi:MAG: D-alanyl-D-alanine carboxypeptidase family protein [Bacillota bacterium]
MGKTIGSFFLIVLLLLGTIKPLSAAENFWLRADAALLMEAGSGQVLFAKNPQKLRSPASITKVVTAAVAVGLADLAEVVEISPKAAGTKIGSDAGLRAGDQLLLSEILKASLVASANDAAMAVAEHIGGNGEFFAELMRRQSAIMGAFNSDWVNPNGYSKSGHYSTAQDLALISRQALANKTIASMVAIKSTEMKWLNRPVEMTLENTNHLLWGVEGADGVKTGTTRAAGRCLAASATRSGRQLIAVVLDSSARFGEAAFLLNYGFRETFFWQLAASERYTVLPVASGEKPYLGVVAKNYLGFTVPRGKQSSLAYHVSLETKPEAPVKKGQVLGELVVFFEDKEVGRTDLVAEEEVARRGVRSLLNFVPGRK